MAAQGRKKWARAAVCAAALVTPLAVSGCQSQAGAASGTSANAGATTARGGSSSPATSGVSQPSSSTASSSAPTTKPLNATGGTALTVVTDGSSAILMNGEAVDFGTAVHDPSWSPDGTKVAFIDGGGNLVVADADGSGKTEVAKNPGGQTWSHPTWQVTPADPAGVPARDNLFLASSAGGGTLLKVATGAHDGKPEPLTVNGFFDPDATPPPKTGNQWPSASGRFGGSVYEHDNGGSDVFVRDDFLRQQGGLVLKDAAQPGFALVGGSAKADPVPEVVFVRSVRGHRHVFVSSILTSTGGTNNAPKDLTPNATADCTEPAISPDGKTVAFSTPSGVEIVPADGSGKAKQVTDVPGFPAFRSGS